MCPVGTIVRHILQPVAGAPHTAGRGKYYFENLSEGHIYPFGLFCRISTPEGYGHLQTSTAMLSLVPGVQASSRASSTQVRASHSSEPGPEPGPSAEWWLAVSASSVRLRVASVGNIANTRSKGIG